jgi:hypothetical protein
VGVLGAPFAAPVIRGIIYYMNDTPIDHLSDYPEVEFPEYGAKVLELRRIAEKRADDSAGHDLSGYVELRAFEDSQTSLK